MVEVFAWRLLLPKNRARVPPEANFTTDSMDNTVARGRDRQALCTLAFFFERDEEDEGLRFELDFLART